MVTFKDKQAMASRRLAAMRAVMENGWGKFPYGENMYLVNGRLVDQKGWDHYCNRENRLVDRGLGGWN